MGSCGAQLYETAQHARRTMGVDETSAAADRGHYSAAQPLDCERVGTTVYVPKTMASEKKNRGLLDKNDFV
jgi:hypothetical protein